MGVIQMKMPPRLAAFELFDRRQQIGVRLGIDFAAEDLRRAGDGEIVASATGSWAQYELRGVWRPEDQVLQFLALGMGTSAIARELSISTATVRNHSQRILAKLQVHSRLAAVARGYALGFFAVPGRPAQSPPEYPGGLIRAEETSGPG